MRYKATLSIVNGDFAGMTYELADDETLIGRNPTTTITLLDDGISREHSMILFDEANSSLDRESDEKLKEVLAMYCGNAAMVLISHRPSFLKLADRVYVLRDRTLNFQAEGKVSGPLKLKREITA